MSKLSRGSFLFFLFSFSLTVIAHDFTEDFISRSQNYCRHLSPGSLEKMSFENLAMHVQSPQVKQSVKYLYAPLKGKFGDEEYLSSFLVAQYPQKVLTQTTEENDQLIIVARLLGYAHRGFCHLIDRYNPGKTSLGDRDRIKRYLGYLIDRSREFIARYESVKELERQANFAEMIKVYLRIEKLFLESRVHQNSLVKGEIQNFDGAQLQSLEKQIKETHGYEGLVKLRKARYELYKTMKISQENFIRFDTIKRLSESILGRTLVEPYPLYPKDELKNIEEDSEQLFNSLEVLSHKFKVCMYPLDSKTESEIKHKFSLSVLRNISENPSGAEAKELMKYMALMISQWQSEDDLDDLKSVQELEQKLDSREISYFEICQKVERHLDEVHELYLMYIIDRANISHRCYVTKIISNFYKQQEALKGEPYVFSQINKVNQEIIAKDSKQRLGIDSALELLKRKYSIAIFPMDPSRARFLSEELSPSLIKKIIKDPTGSEALELSQKIIYELNSYSEFRWKLRTKGVKDQGEKHKSFLSFVMNCEKFLDAFRQNYMKVFNRPMDPYTREEQEEQFFSQALKEGLISKEHTKSWLNNFVLNHTRYGLNFSDINSSKFSEIFLMKSFSRIALGSSILDQEDFPEILLSQKKSSRKIAF